MKKILVLLLLFLTSCSPDNAVINNESNIDSISEEYIQATMEKVTIDSILASVEVPNLKSISIVRNDELVFENFYGSASESYLSNVFSVTKSITSILTGIAIDEGYLKVDDLINNYLDFEMYGLSDDYQDITIDHLLTMSSGIVLDDYSSNEYHTIKAASDPLERIFEEDLVFDPGSRFQYSDATAYVMGAVLQGAIGMTLEVYAVEKLFEPLEIEDYKWYASRSDVTYPGFDLYLTCDGMQKIGQLILKDGYINNQIVSKSWLEESTTVHMKTYAGSFNSSYGYYWWLGQVENYKVISALGHGGQYITIVPDLDLVITAATYGAVSNDLAGRQGSLLKDIIVDKIIPYYMGE